MDPKDEARIADVTIEEVFRRYLDDERERLSDRTFGKYEDVIGLFTLCMDGYAYQYLDQADAELFNRLYDAKGADHREFTSIFGPEHILRNTDDFLGYFMLRKVMAGKDLLRAAGTVTKKLAKWLAANGFAEAEEAEYAAVRGTKAARDLPAAEDLAMLLDEHTEGTWGCIETEEGHFTITGVEDGRVRVVALSGRELWPIVLPEEVAAKCPVGWTFSGVIGRHGRAWVISEVWTVYPRG